MLDVLVEAGAEVTSLEEAAAAGVITGWLTPESDLQARIRAFVFAADHQRLPVIDQLIDADTPLDAFDEVWGRQALRTAAQNGRPASVRSSHSAALEAVPEALGGRRGGRAKRNRPSSRE